MIANLLLLNGANLNCKLGTNNRTVLHYAAINMDTIAISLLVTHGAGKDEKVLGGRYLGPLLLRLG
jgi:hypothetical protein